MDPTLETILETVAATEAIVETAPPPPPGPTPVILVNDWQWLIQEFNRIYEQNEAIIGLLVFFVIVCLCYFTYRLFRLFF